MPPTDKNPFSRTLKIGMGGQDVAAYQLMLHNFTLDNPKSKVRPYGVSPGGPEHYGFMGKAMAGQVDHLRKLHNQSHKKDIIPASGGMIGPRMHGVLTNWSGPDAEALLAAQWEKLHPSVSARDIAVEAMKGWYQHHRGVSIYSGEGHATIGRRWDGITNHRLPPDFPRYADCSSGTSWALWVAHLKFPRAVMDPSQNGWSWGSTLSMAPHGKARTTGTALPGDLFFYGHSAWYTTHVAMMVERIGGVPWTVGFGSQGGPWYAPYRYRDDCVLVRSYFND